MIRRMLIWLLVLAMSGTLAFAQKADKKSKAKGGGVEDQIMDLENKGREAALKGDTSFFEQNLADDYMGVSGLGNVVDKNQTIEDRKNGTMKYEAIDLSDQKVRVHGNAALATGTGNVKGTYKGQDVTGTYRYVRVYIKEGGKWKIEHFQATRVVQPAS